MDSICISDGCIHNIASASGVSHPTENQINQWMLINYGISYQNVDGKHVILGKTEDLKWFALSGLI